MTDPASITQETVQGRLSAAMRLFVGQGKKFSTAALAEASGVNERTVKAYRDGEMLPTLVPILRLIATMPPAFADMVLGAAGRGHTREIEEAAATPLVTLAGLAGGANELAQALADGRIDHRERVALARLLRPVIQQLDGFVTGLEAGQ